MSLESSAENYLPLTKYLSLHQLEKLSKKSYLLENNNFRKMPFYLSALRFTSRYALPHPLG